MQTSTLKPTRSFFAIMTRRKKPALPDKIPSNPIVPVRMSADEKALFKNAATKDGKALGTWLKWLAQTRIEQQKSEEDERKRLAAEARLRRNNPEP